MEMIKLWFQDLESALGNNGTIAILSAASAVVAAILGAIATGVVINYIQ